MMKYAAATGILSVAAVMLFSPFLFRAGQKRGIISAAVGIIIYTIVKSIFVECGWGLAASAGTYAGLIAETVMVGLGIAFFSELNKAMADKNGTAWFFFLGVILVAAGKNLSVDYMLIPDISAFIVGRAAQSAMLVVSACLVSDRAGREGFSFPAVWAVVCVSISTLAGLPAGRMPEGVVSAVAPMLILTGCCHLTVVLSGSVDALSEISAGGLAAGFMLSYCFDCLTV